MATKGQPTPASAPITVYGTDWCLLTRTLCEQLERASMTFSYHDIDCDGHAEKTLSELHQGKRKFPTLVIGEVILHKPSSNEVHSTLLAAGLVNAEEAQDSSR